MTSIGFSAFLEDFAGSLGVDRFALYLHDFGSWIGLRLAMRDPSRIAALIVQNGDIYEDVLGPKYAGLKEIWKMDRTAGSPSCASSSPAIISGTSS